MIVYALDIGGTSLKRAIVNIEQNLAKPLKIFKPILLKSRKFDDLRNQIIASVQEVLDYERSFDTIAISTTGGVDKNGIVLNAGHFEGYSNISWEDILKQESTRIKHVITVSDGKAATWAEYIAVMDKVDTFAHFVVGTGIGGGLVHNNESFTGDGGYAGYFGHIKITLGETVKCSCGNTGCVETLAAGPAITRYFREHSIGVLDTITLQNVVNAAQSGNEVAKKSFELAGEYLGVAISTVMNVMNPGIITIGGGVILAADEARLSGSENPYLAAAIKSAKFRAHRRIAAITQIRQAHYGNNAGMIGAALMTSFLRD